jgi:AcrR family transcriptional regulator
MVRARAAVRPAARRRVGQATPDDERSRKRIHTAALSLFSRYGYEGVSLQRIADEVGLHKSSLFHHYPGKLALLDEVLDAVIARVLATVRPLEHDAPPRLATFLRVVDDLVDHFSDEPEAAQMLINAMTAPDDSDLRRADAGEQVLEFFEVVTSWMDRARRAGVIRHLNIRQAIPNVIGLVLFYPAVARDLVALVGREPFSPRARQIRKQEVRYVLRVQLENPASNP